MAGYVILNTKNNANYELLLKARDPLGMPKKDEGIIIWGPSDGKGGIGDPSSATEASPLNRLEGNPLALDAELTIDNHHKLHGVVLGEDADALQQAERVTGRQASRLDQIFRAKHLPMYGHQFKRLDYSNFNKLTSHVMKGISYFYGYNSLKEAEAATQRRIDKWNGDNEGNNGYESFRVEYMKELENQSTNMGHQNFFTNAQYFGQPVNPPAGGEWYSSMWGGGHVSNVFSEAVWTTNSEHNSMWLQGEYDPNDSRRFYMKLRTPDGSGGFNPDVFDSWATANNANPNRTSDWTSLSHSNEAWDLGNFVEDIGTKPTMPNYSVAKMMLKAGLIAEICGFTVGTLFGLFGVMRARTRESGDVVSMETTAGGVKRCSVWLTHKLGDSTLTTWVKCQLQERDLFNAGLRDGWGAGKAAATSLGRKIKSVFGSTASSRGGIQLPEGVEAVNVGVIASVRIFDTADLGKTNYKRGDEVEFKVPDKDGKPLYTTKNPAKGVVAFVHEVTIDGQKYTHPTRIAITEVGSGYSGTIRTKKKLGKTETWTSTTSLPKPQINNKTIGITILADDGEIVNHQYWRTATAGLYASLWEAELNLKDFVGLAYSNWKGTKFRKAKVIQMAESGKNKLNNQVRITLGLQPGIKYAEGDLFFTHSGAVGRGEGNEHLVWRCSKSPNTSTKHTKTLSKTITDQYGAAFGLDNTPDKNPWCTSSADWIDYGKNNKFDAEDAYRYQGAQLTKYRNFTVSNNGDEFRFTFSGTFWESGAVDSLALNRPTSQYRSYLNWLESQAYLIKLVKIRVSECIGNKAFPLGVKEDGKIALDVVAMADVPGSRLTCLHTVSLVGRDNKPIINIIDGGWGYKNVKIEFGEKDDVQLRVEGDDSKHLYGVPTVGGAWYYGLEDSWHYFFNPYSQQMFKVQDPGVAVSGFTITGVSYGVNIHNSSHKPTPLRCVRIKAANDTEEFVKSKFGWTKQGSGAGKISGVDVNDKTSDKFFESAPLIRLTQEGSLLGEDPWRGVPFEAKQSFAMEDKDWDTLSEFGKKGESIRAQKVIQEANFEQLKTPWEDLYNYTHDFLGTDLIGVLVDSVKGNITEANSRRKDALGGALINPEFFKVNDSTAAQLTTRNNKIGMRGAIAEMLLISGTLTAEEKKRIVSWISFTPVLGVCKDGKLGEIDGELAKTFYNNANSFAIHQRKNQTHESLCGKKSCGAVHAYATVPPIGDEKVWQNYRLRDRLGKELKVEIQQVTIEPDNAGEDTHKDGYVANNYVTLRRMGTMQADDADAWMRGRITKVDGKKISINITEKSGTDKDNVWSLTFQESTGTNWIKTPREEVRSVDVCGNAEITIKFFPTWASQLITESMTEVWMQQFSVLSMASDVGLCRVKVAGGGEQIIKDGSSVIRPSWALPVSLANDVANFLTLRNQIAGATFGHSTADPRLPPIIGNYYNFNKTFWAEHNSALSVPIVGNLVGETLGAIQGNLSAMIFDDGMETGRLNASIFFVKNKYKPTIAGQIWNWFTGNDEEVGYWAQGGGNPAFKEAHDWAMTVRLWYEKERLLKLGFMPNKSRLAFDTSDKAKAKTTKTWTVAHGDGGRGPGSMPMQLQAYYVQQMLNIFKSFHRDLLYDAGTLAKVDGEANIHPNPKMVVGKTTYTNDSSPHMIAYDEHPTAVQNKHGGLGKGKDPKDKFMVTQRLSGICFPVIKNSGLKWEKFLIMESAKLDDFQFSGQQRESASFNQGTHSVWKTHEGVNGVIPAPSTLITEIEKLGFVANNTRAASATGSVTLANTGTVQVTIDDNGKCVGQQNSYTTKATCNDATDEGTYWQEGWMRSMAFIKGLKVKLEEANGGGAWMKGVINSYSSDTGLLKVDVSESQGASGTYSSWTVTLLGMHLNYHQWDKKTIKNTRERLNLKNPDKKQNLNNTLNSKWLCKEHQEISYYKEDLNSPDANPLKDLYRPVEEVDDAQGGFPEDCQDENCLQAPKEIYRHWAGPWQSKPKAQMGGDMYENYTQANMDTANNWGSIPVVDADTTIPGNGEWEALAQKLDMRLGKLAPLFSKIYVDDVGHEIVAVEPAAKYEIGDLPLDKRWTSNDELDGIHDGFGLNLPKGVIDLHRFYDKYVYHDFIPGNISTKRYNREHDNNGARQYHEDKNGQNWEAVTEQQVQPDGKKLLKKKYTSAWHAAYEEGVKGSYILSGTGFNAAEAAINLSGQYGLYKELINKFPFSGNTWTVGKNEDRKRVLTEDATTTVQDNKGNDVTYKAILGSGIGCSEEEALANAAAHLNYQLREHVAQQNNLDEGCEVEDCTSEAVGQGGTCSVIVFPDGHAKEGQLITNKTECLSISAEWTADNPCIFVQSGYMQTPPNVDLADQNQPLDPNGSAPAWKEHSVGRKIDLIKTENFCKDQCHVDIAEADDCCKYNPQSPFSGGKLGACVKECVESWDAGLIEGSNLLYGGACDAGTDETTKVFAAQQLGIKIQAAREKFCEDNGIGIDWQRPANSLEFGSCLDTENGTLVNLHKPACELTANHAWQETYGNYNSALISNDQTHNPHWVDGVNWSDFISRATQAGYDNFLNNSVNGYATLFNGTNESQIYVSHGSKTQAELENHIQELWTAYKGTDGAKKAYGEDLKGGGILPVGAVGCTPETGSVTHGIVERRGYGLVIGGRANTTDSEYMAYSVGEDGGGGLLTASSSGFNQFMHGSAQVNAYAGGASFDDTFDSVVFACQGQEWNRAAGDDHENDPPHPLEEPDCGMFAEVELPPPGENGEMYRRQANWLPVHSIIPATYRIGQNTVDGVEPLRTEHIVSWGDLSVNEWTQEGTLSENGLGEGPSAVVGADIDHEIIDWGWLYNKNDIVYKDQPRLGYGFTGCPCEEFVTKWVEASRNEAFNNIEMALKTSWAHDPTEAGTLGSVKNDAPDNAGGGGAGCDVKYGNNHARENATYGNEIADGYLVSHTFESIIQKPTCLHGGGGEHASYLGMSDFASYYTSQALGAGNQCVDGPDKDCHIPGPCGRTLDDVKIANDADAHKYFKPEQWVPPGPGYDGEAGAPPIGNVVKGNEFLEPWPHDQDVNGALWTNPIDLPGDYQCYNRSITRNISLFQLDGTELVDSVEIELREIIISGKIPANGNVPEKYGIIAHEYWTTLTEPGQINTVETKNYAKVSVSNVDNWMLKAKGERPVISKRMNHAVLSGRAYCKYNHHYATVPLYTEKYSGHMYISGVVPFITGRCDWSSQGAIILDDVQDGKTPIVKSFDQKYLVKYEDGQQGIDLLYNNKLANKKGLPSRVVEGIAQSRGEDVTSALYNQAATTTDIQSQINNNVIVGYRNKAEAPSNRSADASATDNTQSKSGGETVFIGGWPLVNQAVQTTANLSKKFQEQVSWGNQGRNLSENEGIGYKLIVFDTSRTTQKSKNRPKQYVVDLEGKVPKGTRTKFVLTGKGKGSMKLLWGETRTTAGKQSKTISSESQYKKIVKDIQIVNNTQIIANGVIGVKDKKAHYTDDEGSKITECIWTLLKVNVAACTGCVATEIKMPPDGNIAAANDNDGKMFFGESYLVAQKVKWDIYSGNYDFAVPFRPWDTEAVVEMPGDNAGGKKVPLAHWQHMIIPPKGAGEEYDKRLGRTNYSLIGNTNDHKMPPTIGCESYMENYDKIVGFKVINDRRWLETPKGGLMEIGNWPGANMPTWAGKASNVDYRGTWATGTVAMASANITTARTIELKNGSSWGPTALVEEGKTYRVTLYGGPGAGECWVSASITPDTNESDCLAVTGPGVWVRKSNKLPYRVNEPMTLSLKGVVHATGIIIAWNKASGELEFKITKLTEGLQDAGKSLNGTDWPSDENSANSTTPRVVEWSVNTLEDAVINSWDKEISTTNPATGEKTYDAHSPVYAGLGRYWSSVASNEPNTLSWNHINIFGPYPPVKRLTNKNWQHPDDRIDSIETTDDGNSS